MSDENRKIGISIYLRQKYVAIIDKWITEGKYAGISARGGVVEKLVEQAYEVAQNRDLENKLHGKGGKQ